MNTEDTKGAEEQQRQKYYIGLVAKSSVLTFPQCPPCPPCSIAFETAHFPDDYRRSSAHPR